MKADPKEGGRRYPKMKQEDLGDHDVVIFTIQDYEQRKMPDGNLLRLLHFAELEEADLPLRLNATQLEYLIAGLGSDETNDWIDKQVPIEKVTKQGPDGQDYDVVWVCAPESWPHLFKDAGLPIPSYVAALAKAVKPAAKKPAGIRRAKSGKGKRK
jgi:hypothetical protein